MATNRLFSEGNSQKHAIGSYFNSGSAHQSRTYPKKAIPNDQKIPIVHVNFRGGLPSFFSFRRPKAGMIPTNPAASGIVPVATAVVCNTTFSWAVNGLSNNAPNSLPISAD